MSAPVDYDEQGQEMYNVEKIVDDKYVHGKRLFLVKWEGWPDSANTWEPKEHFDQDLLAEYLELKRKDRQHSRHGERVSSQGEKRTSEIAFDRSWKIIGDDIFNHSLHFHVQGEKGETFWVVDSEVPADVIDEYYVKRVEGVQIERTKPAKEKVLDPPMLVKRKSSAREDNGNNNKRNRKIPFVEGDLDRFSAKQQEPPKDKFNFNPSLIRGVSEKEEERDEPMKHRSASANLDPFYFVNTSGLEALVAGQAPKQNIAEVPPDFEPYIPENFLAEEEAQDQHQKLQLQQHAQEKEATKNIRRGTFNKDKPLKVIAFMYDVFQTQNMFVQVKWATTNTGLVPRPTWVNVVEANKKIPELLAAYYVRMVKRHSSFGKMLQLLTYVDRQEKFSLKYLRPKGSKQQQ